MFHIHQTSCISPQHTFQNISLDELNEPKEGRLLVIEPAYSEIPPGILRRMGKSVKMGIGAAMPLLQHISAPDGIIIGTANGGKEACVRFLNQVKDYDEGILTPVDFVQSTPNAVAAQIGMFTKNHGYNVSHLHMGLAFEFAMIDADMLISENETGDYLLGAVDDISTYNFYLEEKGGWYKKNETAIADFYAPGIPGSIAGEGAAMFIVNKNKINSLASVHAIEAFHEEDELQVEKRLREFLSAHLTEDEKIDLIISGENGDDRLLKYYESCENVVGENVAVARFKHLCGEYPTATAMALWLSCEILQKGSMPSHIMKREGLEKKYNRILIYNTYKGIQHSFILVSR